MSVKCIHLKNISGEVRVSLVVSNLDQTIKQLKDE
jgi:hypothetical protein